MGSYLSPELGYHQRLQRGLFVQTISVLRLLGSVLSIPTANALREKALQPTDKVETIIAKSISFKSGNVKTLSRSVSFKTVDEESISSSNRPEKMVLQRSLSFKNWEPQTAKLETTVSTKNQEWRQEKSEPPATPRPLRSHKAFSLQRPVAVPDLIINSPRPKSELDAAAVTLQKVYKSYRTRRNLADCAVVVEELWWKALDFAALEQSSVLFFNIQKSESAVSRWARARTRVAKVGKGLSKDEKAQKLALRHWLEAIDPRHRYGHNLHLYYDAWFDSESTQPFFYWLDVGDGKEVNLQRCPRSRLQRQCVQYLGPNEREAFEVIVKDGKLVYKQSQEHVNTVEGSKWIFVLSTSRSLYVGQKKKGTFQHSSFLAGGATTAAGRLVAEQGDLKAIWPYSGHYLPTEENFKEFIFYLEEHNVDLSNVKRCATDDDYLSFSGSQEGCTATSDGVVEPVPCPANKPDEEEIINSVEQDNAPRFQLGKPLSCKWSTGAGPRIGCVRDYPAEMQFRALETVNLSPRVTPAACAPIPSPRPSPKFRLSPRLSYMGLPSPRVHSSPKVLPSPRAVILQQAK